MPRRGLESLVRWHLRTYGVTPDDRATLVASPAFDASVWELWPCLAAGASLHVPDEETRLDPARLLDWMAAEGITIAFNAKRPGPGMHLGRVAMAFDYAEDFAQVEIADAYQRLIMEAMGGDHSLFIRQDGVERAWEILQPVLDHPQPIHMYERGSWGPPEADDLIAPRKWHVTGKGDAQGHMSRVYPIVEDH